MCVGRRHGRQCVSIGVGWRCMRHPRDLSFIEIVAAQSVARSRLFRIIGRQDPVASPRGGGEGSGSRGVGATGDGDGPLRDTFTNRDINIKRSFIFFYAPLSRPPTATSLANFNETLPATPRENSRRPLPHLLSLSLTPFPGDPARSYEFTLGFPCTIYVAGAAACSATENFMTTSCSLYIWVPPIRATPRIDHVFGWYIYAVAGEYWERRTIRPSGDRPLKSDARVSDFKARNMKRISPMRAASFFLHEKPFHRPSFFFFGF